MRTTDNQLLTRRLRLTLEQARDRPATLLSDWLSNESFLYSYIVRCKTEDGEVIDYTVQVCISQIEEYNTIPVPEAILQIVDSLNNHQAEYVIDYRQPPLDVMVEAFAPFVHSLARQVARQWNQEFEDMVQTCYMCMIILYNKGYYIHKSLLTTTFIREVLTSLRKQNIAYKHGYKGTVSIDSDVPGADGLKYSDIISDEEQEDMIYSFEYNDEKEWSLITKRKLVVDKIGERRYKSYVDDVESGSLSKSSRTTLWRLGKKLRSKYKPE